MVGGVVAREVQGQGPGSIRHRGLKRTHVAIPVQLYVPAQQAEVVRIGLVGEDPATLAHGSSEDQGVVADVRADVDRDVARMYEGLDKAPRHGPTMTSAAGPSPSTSTEGAIPRRDLEDHEKSRVIADTPPRPLRATKAAWSSSGFGSANRDSARRWRRTKCQLLRIA